MSKKILILEDSPLIQKALEDLLRMEGYEVKIVDSVAGARDMEHRKGPFHGYLLDGNVHGSLRGEVFAQELLDAGRKLVIVISADAQKSKAPKALYMPKPLRFEQILEAIK